MTSPTPATRSGAGPTDAALVVAARAGDRWAQEALFQRHVRMVVGLSHRVLADDLEVDDLVQDCFVQALSRLDTLHNPQAFASWMCSIVVRTAAKRLRRRRLARRLGLRQAAPVEPDALVAPTTPPDVAAELRVVYSVLERLPAEERIALVLRRVEGLQMAEIAEQMGLSLPTVKRRLAAAEARLERARRRL